MIDVNRLHHSDLPLSTRVGLFLRGAVVAPPAPPMDADEFQAPHFYAYACEHVRAASSSALSAPPNPVNKDPDGREYRSVPVIEWAPRAYPGTVLPAELAALAAVAVSEAPDVTKFPQYALAILEACCNAADKAGITIEQRVTMRGVQLAGGKRAPNAGCFARQSGRWCASLQWPNGRHVEAARLVLGRRSRQLAPIFGHGAERWVDLRVMDLGVQAGKPLLPADVLVAKWAREGWEVVPPVVVEGEVAIDQYVLALFRRASGAPDVARGLAIVADGRKRWRTK